MGRESLLVEKTAQGSTTGDRFRARRKMTNLHRSKGADLVEGVIHIVKVKVAFLIGSIQVVWALIQCIANRERNV